MDNISEYLEIGKRTTERKLGSKTAERRVVWKKESDSQEAQGVSKTIPEERYQEADQHGAGASHDLEAQSSRSLSYQRLEIRRQVADMLEKKNFASVSSSRKLSSWSQNTSRPSRPPFSVPSHAGRRVEEGSARSVERQLFAAGFWSKGRGPVGAACLGLRDADAQWAAWDVVSVDGK